MSFRIYSILLFVIVVAYFLALHFETPRDCSQQFIAGHRFDGCAALM
jgi:hypothetical protein